MLLQFLRSNSNHFLKVCKTILLVEKLVHRKIAINGPYYAAFPNILCGLSCHRDGGRLLSSREWRVLSENVRQVYNWRNYCDCCTYRFFSCLVREIWVSYFIEFSNGLLDSPARSASDHQSWSDVFVWLCEAVLGLKRAVVHTESLTDFGHCKQARIF